MEEKAGEYKLAHYKKWRSEKKVASGGSGIYFKDIIKKHSRAIAELELDELRALRFYLAKAIKNYNQGKARAAVAIAKGGNKKKVKSNNSIEKNEEFGPQYLYLKAKLEDLQDEEEKLLQQLKIAKLKAAYKAKKPK